VRITDLFKTDKITAASDSFTSISLKPCFVNSFFMNIPALLQNQRYAQIVVKYIVHI